MPLTETWLKANNKKLRDKTIEKADRGGLSARLSPKGKITEQGLSARSFKTGGLSASTLILRFYVSCDPCRF